MKTPPAGLSDGMMGRDRDGEHNPLERPQVSEDKKTVVTDGEASEVAARHFELVMFRQQQGTIAKSIDWGGDYPIQADFAGNPKTATTARRVAAREEAAISRQQRGATSTEQTKQFDPGR